MESFIKEIGKYTKYSKNSSQTKATYEKHLIKLLDYLCNLTEESQDTLHLERIYEVRDVTGKVIYYRPLNAVLIDKYLFSINHNKYSYLASSFYSISSFLKYLNRNYDFPILTQEISFQLMDYKPNNSRKRTLSRHDILRFLQAILKKSYQLERDILLFVLLLSTGSRINEVLNILIKDIDFLNDFIYVKKTKNGQSKIIVLRSGMGLLIKRYVTNNNLSDSNYLFSHNQHKLTRKYVQALFENYLEEANLAKTNLHQLRHTFATLMAENGVQITIIQQLLGHKTINSTKTYIDPNYIRNFGLVVKENEDIYIHIRR